MAAGATREVDAACCFADCADGNAEDMIIVLWALLCGPTELPPATLVLESVEAAFAFATGLRGPDVEALDAFVRWPIFKRLRAFLSNHSFASVASVASLVAAASTTSEPPSFLERTPEARPVQHDTLFFLGAASQWWLESAWSSCQ